MRYVTIAIILVLSLLSACTGDVADKASKDADAIIKEANLTEFEKHMLEIAGTNSFSFDIEIKNKDVKVLHTTIDYYENGAFKEKIVDSSSGLSEDVNDTVRIVFIKQQPSDNQEKWITSVMTESGYTSTESKLDITNRKEIISSSWGGIGGEIPLSLNKKRVIASIINSNKNAVSIRNNIETKQDIAEATDYEQVYLISVELK